MLNISYEFTKGFFFVRLEGNITKNNYRYFLEELKDIIQRTGLKKIVINVEKINSIDVLWLNKLLKFLKKALYKGITVLMCDNNLVLTSRIFNLIPRISYEQEVYNMI